MKKILLLVLLLVVILDFSAGSWWKKGRKNKPTASTCSITNCKKCHSNQYSCDECNRGFVRASVPLGFACWRYCPLGFQNVKGTCIKVCPKNCEKCRNRYSCSVCESGYALFRRFFRSSCVQKCPKGYKLQVNPVGGNQCVKLLSCKPNCKTCQNRFSCSVCEDGHALYRGVTGLGDGRCFKNCPKGYKQEVNPSGGLKCVKLCTPNCKTCQNRFSCSVCEDEHALYRGVTGLGDGRCFKKCPKGYKQEVNPSGGLKCVKQCQVPSCDSCPNRWGMLERYRCERCKPDFYKLTVGKPPFQQQDFCFSRCPSGYVPRKENGVPECVLDVATTTGEPTTDSYWTWTTAEPEPTTAEDPTIESDWSTTPESFTTPEPITFDLMTTEQSTTEADWSTSPDSFTTPEPTTFDLMTTEESTTEADWSTSPDSFTTPEPTTFELMSTEEPTTEPDWSTTEVTTTEEPTTELYTTDSYTTPEPTTEPEPTVFTDFWP